MAAKKKVDSRSADPTPKQSTKKTPAKKTTATKTTPLLNVTKIERSWPDFTAFFDSKKPGEQLRWTAKKDGAILRCTGLKKKCPYPRKTLPVRHGKNQLKSHIWYHNQCVKRCGKGKKGGLPSQIPQQ